MLINRVELVWSTIWIWIMSLPLVARHRGDIQETTRARRRCIGRNRKCGVPHIKLIRLLMA